MRKAFLSVFLTTALFATACATPAESDSGDLLLVGNKGEHTVSFIDLNSGVERARIPTSQTAPHEIAISPDRKYAAVVNYGNAAIDILDIAARTIVHSYNLGENRNPHGIVWQDNGDIFATTEGGESIIRLNAAPIWDDRKLEAVRTNERGTHMLAVSADGSRAYTVNLGGGTISAIDLTTNKLIKTVPGGNEPEGVDLAKDDSELWVSARGGDEVYVLDAQTLDRLATIPVGGFPLRLINSPDGTKAVTSNLTDGTISVIDIATRELERTITVSGSREAAQVTLLFSEDGLKLYAAETGTDTIAEIDFASGKVLRRLPAGRQGDGLAIVRK